VWTGIGSGLNAEGTVQRVSNSRSPRAVLSDSEWLGGHLKRLKHSIQNFKSSLKLRIGRTHRMDVDDDRPPDLSLQPSMHPRF
jgi:hypothetical protein